MARFVYEARNISGQNLKGEVEAANEAEARVKLRAQKLVPIRVGLAQAKTAPKGGFFLGGGVSSKDMQIFTRQLSTLLGAGIPILQAIDTLGTGTRSPALTVALRVVGQEISRGKRLAEALAEHPRVFNRFFVNMVRAGEESGNLDTILQRLAAYIEKSVKLQNKVLGALIYPAVILVISFLVVIGLLVFVVPKLQSFFTQMQGELPTLTRLVIFMSDQFLNYWYIVIGGMCLSAYSLIAYYRTDQGRKTCDAVAIRMPLFGELIEKSSIAKFTRTLSVLLGSGVGIMEALEISARTVGNFVIEAAIFRARDSITEGKSLTVPLAKERHIPHMVVQMIGVGEQTGNLDQMLSRVADFYEDEVDVAVGALTTIIEPVMMVCLGAVIAVLVIAMYLPIFNMAGAIGNG